MATPPLQNPGSEVPALLKSRQGSLKRTTFTAPQIHRARGFVRRQVKGRIPVTRPVRRP